MVLLKCREDCDAKHSLDIMYHWILSWFKTLETMNEVNHSLTLLKSYLCSKEASIGTSSSEQALILITKIIRQQEMLLHPYFKTTTTFDFIGDSIVESSNSTLKRGPIAVNKNMDIACSARTQVKATEVMSIKRIVKSAKMVNQTVTWSVSQTAKYLTDYAEGLACSVFDRRKLYFSVYLGKFCWLVIYKSHFDELKSSNWSSKNTFPPKYLRIRVVTISDDMFMNCSCGYHIRWLKPCVHMCCIIHNIELYTAVLFHIRWWKHFHYSFKNETDEFNSNLSSSTSNTLNYIRSNHYNSNDYSYKGICIDGTKFHEFISVDSNLVENDVSNSDTQLMLFLYDYNIKQDKPILFGCPQFQQYAINSISDINSFNSSSETHTYSTVNNSNITDNMNTQQNIQSMGAGSEVFSQLSQFRENIDTITTDAIDNTSQVQSVENKYLKLDPLFKELLNNINNDNQLQEAVDTIQSLTYKFASQSMGDRIIDDHETTFLGEVKHGGKKESRFKFQFEKHKSNKNM